MLGKMGIVGWLALGIVLLLSYGDTEATMMFKLEYRRAADVKALLLPLFEDESRPEEWVWIDETSNTIFIKNHENMELVHDIIRKVDVLPPSIQMEIILVKASKSDKGPMFPESAPQKLKEIAPKLKGLFAFSSYELLDNMFLTAESGAEISVSSGSDYYVECLPSFVDEGKGIIRLRGFELRKPDGKNLLATSLNLKNGDTVIVGGSKIDGNGMALITVVTARTVE